MKLVGTMQSERQDDEMVLLHKTRTGNDRQHGVPAIERRDDNGRRGTGDGRGSTV